MDGSSGEYPGTYSFEDDNDDDTGTDISWVDVDESDENCEARKIAAYLNHKDVMRIYDNNNDGNIDIKDNFVSGQTTGTVEFWLVTTDVTKQTTLFLNNENGDASIFFQLNNSKLQYCDGVYHSILDPVVNLIYYHIRFDFNCTTDTYDIYVDNILKIEGADFQNVATTLNNVRIFTNNADSGYYSYFDAFGYSWDTDYDIGDNIDGKWVELLGKVENPDTDKAIGTTSICSVKIWDFEGSLYDTWYIRDFTPIRITDDDDTIIFSGYLTSKEFICTRKENYLLMQLEGFSKKLDWSPNDQNYLLEEGLISATSYNLPDSSYALHANNDMAYGVCWDGTHYYIVDQEDVIVYKYDVNWGHVANFALDDGVNPISNPYDICFDGTFFYVTDFVDGKVYKYNNAFVWQADALALGGVLGITYKDTYFYVAIDDYVKKYSAAWVLQETYEVDYLLYGLAAVYNQFYGCYGGGNKVYIYDESFNEVDSFTLNQVCGACVNDLYLYYTVGGSNSYAKFYNGVALDDDYAVEVTDLDENVFDWNPDANKWILGRNDVGILINNTPDAVDTETFVCDSISQTYGTVISGDKDSLDVVNDGDIYIVQDNASPACFIDIELTNAGIADTNSLKSFTIDYKIGVKRTEDGSKAVSMHLYIVKNDGTLFDVGYTGSVAYDKLEWVSNINEELQRESGYDLTEFIENNGGNWDTINLRAIIYDSASGEINKKAYIDYLEIVVEYDSIETPPVLEQIIGNFGDGVNSWIACDYDFVASQIGVGAEFKIGENTNKILADLFSNSELSYYNNSTFSKYMARTFYGDNNMLVLKRVCELEGVYWVEDHLNEQIVISIPGDFEDSGLTFTQANYDHDWKIGDECNHVKQVKVYGADKTIIVSAIDTGNNTSKIVKQIVDSTINTRSEAQEIANTQLAILKDKRPSIKIVLNYALYTLEPMQTINLTFVRPTIAAADYVVRKMNVKHLGYDKDDNEIMQTIIYCGLGSSPIEEKLNNLLKNMEEKIHKLKTNKYNE